jgi:tetratricopeptide (TPR) repeat protein
MQRQNGFPFFPASLALAFVINFGVSPASIAASISVSKQSLPPSLALLAAEKSALKTSKSVSLQTKKPVNAAGKLTSTPATVSSAPSKKVLVTAKAFMARSTSKTSAEAEAEGNPATMQALLNKANAAVKQKDYATAISIYESVLGKEPKDKHYRRNLSILYFNYGVELQDKQAFEAAQKAFDRSVSLTQADSSDMTMVLDAKASAYYSQAMSLRSSIAESKPSGTYATPAELEKIRALLKQAIQLSPSQGVYKQGMASTYLDEAFDLASQDRFKDAIPVLEKAKSYDPENDSVKESLANVYLGVARNDSEHQQMWIDKALAADKSPHIVQMAEQIRQGAYSNSSQNGVPPTLNPSSSRGEGISGLKKAGAAAQQWPSSAPAKAPADITKLSVREMITTMESTLGITPQANENLVQRLEAIESPLFGKPSAGNLTQRTKTAYTALMGQSTTKTAQTSKEGSVANMGEPLTGLPDNTYLDAILKITDGKIVRWGRFPLRVYFDVPVYTETDEHGKTKTVKGKTPTWYHSEYPTIALAGFNSWEEKTGGFIHLVEVKNPGAADILVHWTDDHYHDRYLKPTAEVTDVYHNYTPPKHTGAMRAMQVASMATPGYFRLAPQAIGAAMQYKEARKFEILKKESTLNLPLADLKNLSTEAAHYRLQNMSAREFGHALGLKGISTDSHDLLSASPISETEYQVPSTRDINTLRALYNRPANIVLNTH